MNTYSDLLFKLIRLALGTENDLSFPSDAPWGDVYDMSCSQSVKSVAFDGLKQIYEKNPILGKELDALGLKAYKYNWYGNSRADETDYEKHCNLLKSICEACLKEGIELLLLKGLACGLNYPVPSHRTCGDIDIFPIGGERAWNKVNDLLLSMSPKVKRTTDKHTQARIDGVLIENHLHLYDDSSYRADAKAEALLFPESIDNLLYHRPYYIFPPSENWFYLIGHMSQHFCADGEMSARQFLDLALLLDRHRDEIDTHKVRVWLEQTGFMRMNDLLVSISSDITGFQLDGFIFTQPSEEDKSRVMIELLNRDRKRDFPVSLFPRIIYKYKKMNAGRWKYSYVPRTFTERVTSAIKLHILQPGKI